MHLHLAYDRASLQPTLDSLAARSQLVEASLPPGLEAAFQGTAQYRSAFSSNAIEGNPLAFQAALPFMTGEAQATTRAEHEARQLIEAYEHGYRWASDPAARFDEGVIRALHSVLLRGSDTTAEATRGAYRRKLVRAGNYTAPPPEHVAELMAAYVADLNAWIDTEPGPVAAALAHFGLVSIHPFEDGNGRTARLVADLVLDRTGTSLRRIISISERILQQLDAYHDVLRHTQGPTFVEHIDVTAFVRFHLESELGAIALLEQGAANVLHVIADLDAWMGPAIPEHARLSKALAYMLLVGPISSSQYARLCACSQATATADLRSATEGGLLVREGGGRSTRYHLPNPRGAQAPA